MILGRLIPVFKNSPRPVAQNGGSQQVGMSGFVELDSYHKYLMASTKAPSPPLDLNYGKQQISFPFNILEANRRVGLKRLKKYLGFKDQLWGE